MNPRPSSAVIMMLRLCLGLTLPLLLGQILAGQVLGQPAPPKGWRTFTPKDAAFSVSLPRPPRESKQQLKLSTGNVHLTFLTCAATVKVIEESGDKVSGDVTLVVGVTEYPESEVDGGEDKRLRNARDGAVDRAKGKLIHERKLSFAGYPGRELWIQTNDDAMIHTRLYAVKQRLYQTMALGPKTLVESKEVAAFLDSFKLRK